jgi:hypothetical protein
MYEQIKFVGVAEEISQNTVLMGKLSERYPGVKVVGMNELVAKESNKEKGLAILVDKNLSDGNIVEILRDRPGLIVVIRETNEGFSQTRLLGSGKPDKSFVFPFGTLTT